MMSDENMPLGDTFQIIPPNRIDFVFKTYSIKDVNTAECIWLKKPHDTALLQGLTLLRVLGEGWKGLGVSGTSAAQGQTPEEMV